MSCGCPKTARRISTKGRGRGFVCHSKSARKFVKAVGCSTKAKPRKRRR